MVSRRNCASIFVPLACAVIVFFTANAATFADSAQDKKLAAAIKAYEDGRSEAKDVVIAQYREVIAAETKRKRIEVASRMQDEMKMFEKDGIFLGRSEIMEAFRKYGKAQKQLADTLTEAYGEAAADAVKAGDAKRSEALLTELKGRSLPTKLISFKVNFTDLYVGHGDYKSIVVPAKTTGERLNCTFEVVNGLADTGSMSFRSINIPSHYLSHGGFRLRLTPYEDSKGFRENATFRQVPGLAGSSASSFESLNYPKHFIRVRQNKEVWVDKNDGSDKFRREATFSVGTPLLNLWQ